MNRYTPENCLVHGCFTLWDVVMEPCSSDTRARKHSIIAISMIMQTLCTAKLGTNRHRTEAEHKIRQIYMLYGLQHERKLHQISLE